MESLVARRSDRMRLGCFPQEGLLSEREVLAAGDQETTQAARDHGPRAYRVGPLLSGVENRPTVSGTRTASVGRKAKEPHYLAPCQAARQTGHPRPLARSSQTPHRQRGQRKEGGCIEELSLIFGRSQFWFSDPRTRQEQPCRSGK